MKLIHSCIALLILLVLSVSVSAAQSANFGKATILIKKTLPDFPGHKGIMLTVTFPPGQGAEPHKHPGSVFAYVLEGRIISQLQGQKPVTYHQGQYWYEPPYVGHLICKNPSHSKPAKIIVWQLVPNNSPILLPLSSKGGRT